MARLRSIRIAGWKSIQRIEPKLELGPINVLIGANGSGKSNFISFFKMLIALINDKLQTYFGREGFAQAFLHHGSKVTQCFEGDLEFEVDADRYLYIIRLCSAVADSLVFTEERIDVFRPDSPRMTLSLIDSLPSRESWLRKKAVDPRYAAAQPIYQLLRRCLAFHFNDTSSSARIRNSVNIEDNHFLKPDGSNLAAMIFLYKRTQPAVYRHIVAAIRKIMPNFDDFVLESRLNPQYVALSWRQQGSEYLFGPHQFSDGTLRAMALITLFLQFEEDFPALIIVDEPELGLHPHAIEIISGLIRAASLKTQVILTTQSTTFLDHFAPEEIIVVDREDGSSTLMMAVRPHRQNGSSKFARIRRSKTVSRTRHCGIHWCGCDSSQVRPFRRVADPARGAVAIEPELYR
jgi:predicted ATPase